MSRVIAACAAALLVTGGAVAALVDPSHTVAVGVVYLAGLLTITKLGVVHRER